MKNATTGENGTGWEFVATDDVPESDLARYVTDAKTRWDEVTIEDLQEN